MRRSKLILSLSIAVFLLLAISSARADWAPGDDYKMHFPQMPDVVGWDVNATNPLVLADDWLCTETGWVKDIHFWGSWMHGVPGMINGFILSIHADIPAQPGGYSMPAQPPLWQIIVTDYIAIPITGGEEGWFDPISGYIKPDHMAYFQYNVFLPRSQWFWQDEGTIYWLNISAIVPGPPGTKWGWKTSINHWNDDSVWAYYQAGSWWEELIDPITGISLDQAFVITGDRNEPTVYPEVSTECPVVQTQCPIVETQCQLTKCPAMQTQCPLVETQCPAGDTWCPVEQTECPQSTTHCPVVNTQCPVIDTQCPERGPTICPETSTQCPAVETQCPLTQTLCPQSFTWCPTQVTFCPVMPTLCPNQPTFCPPLSTQCEFTMCATPTFCPPVQTNCPFVFTTCPVIATACPAPVPPPIQTVCPEIATQCPVVQTMCQTPVPTVCPVDPTYCPLVDTDGDGVDDCHDNCPTKPNGPNGGTCTKGIIGKLCMNNGECGTGGICSKNQEDTCPPQGNGIGDACDCEGNFDCDRDVDATDVTSFLADFGRSIYNKPCINADPCDGDFYCDGDVDANDVTKFLEDFGRSQYINPCPLCTPGTPWCVYP